jgi:ADP-ribose pyrophosphatase YjhB (NUDIX family)
MFHYCPVCASAGIQFEARKRFHCPDCGFVYYHNTAAASGCVISNGEAVVVLVRGKDPASGKLDLPGGFVENGEGVLEGLRRECQEELGLDLNAVAPGREFSFLASFPNTYPYKGVVYYTCDLFFTITAPGLRLEDMCPDPSEIAEVRLVKPADIRLEDMAFESTRRAVRAYLAGLT